MVAVQTQAAQTKALTLADFPDKPFNPKDLEPQSSIKDAIVFFLLKNAWILRTFFPIKRIGNIASVVRFDDVQEVLSRDDIFGMELEKKHKLVTGGYNFLLGMDESPDYRRMRSQLMKAFRREDVPLIARQSAFLANDIIKRARGRLDAVQDLITAVPTRICEHYYGIVLDEETRTLFPLWSFAISQYLFGNTEIVPTWQEAAVAAAKRIHKILDVSIAKAKDDYRRGIRDRTIILRLLEAQHRDHDALSEGELRASLIGMIEGFIPTNTTAAGNLFDFMLQRDDIQNAAQDAARTKDDETLYRILIEASRLAGGIGFGRFRQCVKATTLGVGTRYETQIPKGCKILVGTASAMFDGRRVKHPYKFNPDRDPFDYLLFGQGMHACLGVLLAKAQITQTLKPLLQKENLRLADGEAGRLTKFGIFPQHLIVEFDP